MRGLYIPQNSNTQLTQHTPQRAMGSHSQEKVLHDLMVVLSVTVGQEASGEHDDGIDATAVVAWGKKSRRCHWRCAFVRNQWKNVEDLKMAGKTAETTYHFCGCTDIWAVHSCKTLMVKLEKQLERQCVCTEVFCSSEWHIFGWKHLLMQNACHDTCNVSVTIVLVPQTYVWPCACS